MNWKDVFKKAICESFVEPWNELRYKDSGCLCVHIVSEEFTKDAAAGEFCCSDNLSADSVT